MGLFHEPKKTSRADLDRIRPLAFNFALVLTLLMVILAFEWKTSTKGEEKITARTTSVFDEVVDVPPTDLPPPPPPALQQPRIVEVPNEEEIVDEIKVEFDIDVTNNTVIQDITYEAPKVEEPEEETDKIFLVVEQTAAPVGGMEAFYKYVSENIRYPAQARRMNLEGKVFIEFVVEKDGSITMVQVVKGIGGGCDEEAVRIVQGSPNWHPGKQRGRPVKQRMVLPIYFKLASRD